MGSNHHSHGKSDPEINISIPGIFVDAEPYRVAKWSRAEIRPKLRVKNIFALTFLKFGKSAADFFNVDGVKKNNLGLYTNFERRVQKWAPKITFRNESAKVHFVNK